VARAVVLWLGGITLVLTAMFWRWPLDGVALPLLSAVLLSGVLLLAAERHEGLVPFCAVLLFGMPLFWAASLSYDVGAQLLPLRIGALAAALALALGSSVRPRLQAWLAVLAATCLLVAWFSGGAGAADPMLDFVVRTFGLDEATAGAILRVFRKSVHFLFYGFVGYAAFQVVRETGSRPLVGVAAGMLFVLFLALFDEIRQATIPGRTGSALDVLLNLAGATTFIVLAARRDVRRDTPTR
jgi:hypothetical protein